jgi:hypothetical protein
MAVPVESLGWADRDSRRRCEQLRELGPALRGGHQIEVRLSRIYGTITLRNARSGRLTARGVRFSFGTTLVPVHPAREMPTEMLSRPLLLIAGLVGGILAGVALFVLALALVAADGAALSGQMMALLVLGAMLGLVLDAAWLTLAVDRLLKLGRGGEGEDGADGGGGSVPNPAPPRPPSEDPDWWPEFEREFRDYRESRELSERVS